MGKKTSPRSIFNPAKNPLVFLPLKLHFNRHHHKHTPAEAENHSVTRSKSKSKSKSELLQLKCISGYYLQVSGLS